MTPRINLEAVLARAAGPSMPAVPDTPLALLRLLRDMGIALRLDGNRLYVDVTAGNVTLEMLEALRQQQDELLTLVETYEERSALLEYDAGLPRAEAEREAWRLLEARYGQRE